VQQQLHLHRSITSIYPDQVEISFSQSSFVSVQQPDFFRKLAFLRAQLFQIQ
jgi:hypothetical protein